MLTEERLTYEIQSEDEPEKWYHVVIEPGKSWTKVGCNCADYLWRGQDCKHIRRAMECYELGL